VTWLVTARGLEEFACEFDGIAARVAQASGLALPPRKDGVTFYDKRSAYPDIPPASSAGWKLTE